jgi:hypothetical protein
MFRLLLALVICSSGAAAHAETGVANYALVVGSNAAGPGQTELQFAEDDARRMGAILTELGGYAPASVDVVVHPTPAILRERLARLEQRVAADTAAGRQVRVFFYYSGHARSTAIDLGPEALPLAELRQRLFAVPAKLTVVVLDACQSGAFSRVKGASPAADFSFNSRQQLDATGIAVLASSSGSELSQESEHLKSSYFTHHLLVGMRGAGDANRDGQVSVDEAYRYAYHQTLLATAVTAVGGQHVTLEVDLKGHGEVPLSFPRVASASIELPAALEGHALVQDRRAKAVVAETHKARGAAVRIAVAPGDYEVTVRQGSRLLRCQVVAPGTIELGRCASEAVTVGTRKGMFAPSWRIAVDASIGGDRSDGFEQTLRDFSFVEEDGTPGGFSLSITREVWIRGHSIGAYVGAASAPGWTRETEREPLRFEWSTTTVGVTNHVERGLTRRLFGYADLLLGVGIGRTRFADQDDKVTTETHVGPAATLGAGVGLRGAMLVPELALTLGMKASWAPVIQNEIGERHDSGGLLVGMGLQYTYGGAR